MKAKANKAKQRQSKAKERKGKAMAKQSNAKQSKAQQSNAKPRQRDACFVMNPYFGNAAGEGQEQGRAGAPSGSAGTLTSCLLASSRLAGTHLLSTLSSSALTALLARRLKPRRE